MDCSLNQAAQEGDIKALYTAIAGDPFILDKIDSVPFIDSPLHFAASAGQTRFAMEVMMMKPSLARKLNKNCYTAVHLAFNNYLDQVNVVSDSPAHSGELMVRGLLSRDPDLIRVNGKEGKTPLHYMVSIGGDPSLLGDLLAACPDSVKDITGQGETVLHLAVRNNQFRSFQVLIEHVKAFEMEEIYSWKDEQGNTFLHCATRNRQLEMLKTFFESYRFHQQKLRLDAKDGSGQTVPDLILEFCHDGALNPNNPHWIVRLYFTGLAIREVPKTNRDTLLVVFALVLTASFQVGLNPPGGFWQDSGTHNGKPYLAGTPVLATTSPVFYQVISFFAFAAFVTSFDLTLLLAAGTLMNVPLHLAVHFLAYTSTLGYIAISRKLGIWRNLLNYGFAYLLVMVLNRCVLMIYATPKKLLSQSKIGDRAQGSQI